MFVRQAGGSDVPAMFRIYNSNLDDYFAPENIEFFMLQWPRGQLVAETVTGCIAGSLSSYLMEDGTASIALLAVDAPYRRMGAGKALINQLKTECWASGIKRMQLLQPSLCTNPWASAGRLSFHRSTATEETVSEWFLISIAPEQEIHDQRSDNHDSAGNDYVQCHSRKKAFIPFIHLHCPERIDARTYSQECDVRIRRS